MVLSEEYIFDKLLKNYFQNHNIADIQINSYNQFIEKDLQKIIEEEPKLEINLPTGVVYKVFFQKIVLDKPHTIEENRTVSYITPQEARSRNLTYWGNICVDIKEEFSKNDKVIEINLYKKIIIAKIPIMIHSKKCNLWTKTPRELIKLGECSWDHGGYFIIKGKERVLVAQERAAHNTVYIHVDKKSSKYKYVAEIRSMSEYTGHSVLVKIHISYNGKKIIFSLPYVNQPIPAGIVFKALGFQDEQIINLISPVDPEMHKLIKFLLRDSYFIQTQEEALRYIGKYSLYVITADKKEKYAYQLLSNELLPHLGILISAKERGIFLGRMINKLYKTFLNRRPVDDRDNVSNKRVETSGTLLRELFRTLYKRFIRSLIPYLQKRPDIMLGISRLNSITQGIRHSMSTGTWGVPKNAYTRPGVSQVLSRISFGGFLSHLRRIVIPIGKEGKNMKIRQLHPSQIGFICPCETPEGHMSGIVKNFSLLTKVTTNIPTVHIRAYIENIDEIICINNVCLTDTDCFTVRLNGIILGITKSFEKCLSSLKLIRDLKIIPESVSISFDKIDKEINLFSDDGRLQRVLIPVIDNKSVLSDKDSSNWDELIDKKKIIYRDSYELENSVIAMYEKELISKTAFDFLEIHPSLMLGVMGSMIPYPDHTQSPRNTYQAAMGKQAMGIYSLANNIRSDTVVHELQYPQQPLVRTHASEYMGFDAMPSGINAVVAVMCGAYNQEDSIIMNQSSIERGLFKSWTYRTVTVEEKKMGCGFENIQTPPLNLQLTSRNYQKLDVDGIIKVGSYVKKNDTLVGRIYSRKIKGSNNDEILNTSIYAKKNEVGIIDRIFTSITPDGYKLIKIKIRMLRIPEIGDKFATRAAQKGTIGITYRQEDMPFTKDGITPDIIINSHAFPSRMTINQLIEGIGAKSVVLNPQSKKPRKYCTPFSSYSTNVIEKICNELENIGYERHGNEKMFCGATGEVIDAEIFITPIYYQRLKHLVVEKIHARDHGSMQLLTRQPLEGRSRDGGLRFGEMERDCMISHGCSDLLMDRLYRMSDPYSVPICPKCKQISNSHTECTFCNGDKIIQTNIPYSCKLLTQELNALLIKCQITPSD